MDEEKQEPDQQQEPQPTAKPLRDARGRMLAPLPGAAPPITSATAHDMLQLRAEKRRKLYNIGAQRAVLDPVLRRDFGEDAHLVERAMTLQHIATSPDAGKAAVMADIQLQRAQGYDVKEEEENSAGAAGAVAGIAAGTAAAVLKFLADVLEYQRTHTIQDGETNIHAMIDGELQE